MHFRTLITTSVLNSHKLILLQWLKGQ